jgi:AraC-like DNA-binding protein
VIVLRAIHGALKPPARDALLKRLELTSDILEDVEARVAFDVVLRAWELAAELSDDPFFGLHFGERLPPGAFDIVDYTACSCATLGEAIKRLVRYQRLLHDAVHVSVEERGPELRIAHIMDDARGAGARHAAEAALASYVVRMRVLTGAHVSPREVHFVHAAPRDRGELSRLFGAAVVFDAPSDLLVFDAACSALPLRQADGTLRAILERQADAMVARLPAPNGPFVEIVLRMILRMLPDGEPRLAQAAARLSMSSRVLQRRLSAEGESFQTVLDRARRDLALRYLADPRVTIAETGLLLGFSDPSAFNRAFRRWTGVSPSAHRVGRY